jgi:hypothetical protein
MYSASYVSAQPTHVQSIAKVVADLRRMSIPELKSKYAELFNEACQANNKAWLIKRIAWRMQALAEGDLSEQARHRAAEIADDADLRLSPPRPRGAAQRAPELTQAESISVPLDHRLPRAGTVISRVYQGQELQVLVLPTGFEYAGQIYKSLSAVAKALTGSHCNSFLFFHLMKEKGNDASR